MNKKTEFEIYMELRKVLSEVTYLDSNTAKKFYEHAHEEIVEFLGKDHDLTNLNAMLQLDLQLQAERIEAQDKIAQMEYQLSN